MSWSHRILSPRLVNEDLSLGGLREETRLALRTLCTLLERPDGVDEGVVRGQLDAALLDPAMAQGVLHTMFRSEASRDMHTLYNVMDAIERQMVLRQEESRQDLRAILQFARTLLLTPAHRHRPQVQQTLIQELQHSLQASNVPISDDLSNALVRLSVSVPSSPPAHPDASTAAATAATGSAEENEEVVTSQIEQQSQRAPPDSGTVASVVGATVGPIVGASAPGGGSDSRGGGAVVAHTMVEKVNEASASHIQPQPQPQPLSLGLSKQQCTESSLGATSVVDGCDSSAHGVGWLHTQFPPSSPVLPPSDKVDPHATLLPTVEHLHVVLVRSVAESEPLALAARCGITVNALEQFWDARYPFVLTPPPLSELPSPAYPTCVQVPAASATTMPPPPPPPTHVHAFELRVVSAHHPAPLEWTVDLHRTVMRLVARGLMPASEPAPTSSASRLFGRKAPGDTCDGASASQQRRAVRAPGAVPQSRTSSHRCVHHLLEAGVVTSARLIHDHVPLLHQRLVGGKPVLEWCVILKALDARGRFSVYFLKGGAGDCRYASVVPHDLYYDLAATTSTGRHTPTTPTTTRALRVLRPADIQDDDGRLANVEYFVRSAEEEGPTVLYTANVFGGDHLVCGWYSTCRHEGHALMLYVFHAAPRVVLVFRVHR